jgi:hypothetical protein
MGTALKLTAIILALIWVLVLVQWVVDLDNRVQRLEDGHKVEERIGDD